MKTLTIKNNNAVLKYSGNQLVFRNLLTGKLTYFTGGIEFVLYLEENGVIRALPSDLFALKSSSVTSGKIVLKYEKEELSVCVEYLTKNGIFVKTLNITSKVSINIKRVVLECRELSTEASGGGEGMPVFVGNEMWCGIEYPVANNRITGKVLSFVQAPFEMTDSFLSLPVVYGFNTVGNLSLSFENYIKSTCVKKKPLKIYCDWALHDDLSDSVYLTEELTLANIQNVVNFGKKSGVRFDYYLMDAFWFEENDPYIKFKASTFPNGSTKVVKSINDCGMKFGLWFDINFIHAHMQNWEEYDSMLCNGAHCFAVDKVAELMTSAIEYHIRKNNVKMIKLDFAYFECKNPNHGHSVEHLESKERSVKNYIKMVEYLKSIEPELKILCYNGWTTELDWIGCVKERDGFPISPYWCKYADYLYCGDPRPSEIACADLSTSLVYYTDSMIRNFRKAYIPFNMIDDHGTMMGDTSTIYWLGKKPFRCGTLMNVMRGGEKIHLYGVIDNLDADDCRYMKYISKIYGVSKKGGYSTEFIAGNPSKGEVYGYSLSGDTHGYIVLLNPSSSEKIECISIDNWNGVNFSISQRIVNGELVSVRASTAKNCYNVSLSPNGYVFLEWNLIQETLLPQSTIVCAGENILLNTTKYNCIKLKFKQTDNNTPIRTPLGYPSGLKVYGDGKVLAGEITKGIWSGISWVMFNLENVEEFTVAYENGAPLIMEYLLLEEMI